jgi:hypothetical protein
VRQARTTPDIELELLNPYGDMRLRHSSHIMVLARPYLTFDGEDGDRRVRELLQEVYEAALYVYENRAALGFRWRRLSEALAARCPSRARSESDLVRLRRESRKLLRSGAITAEQHELALKLANNELNDWLMAAEDALDELWRDTPVPPSLWRQLMLLIDPSFPQDDLD